jgi:hypothetical protein
MTLLARLRTPVGMYTLQTQALANEAADEIERLREALRLARKDLLSAVELINVELANEQPAVSRTSQVSEQR